jgi:hypothetical protein
VRFERLCVYGYRGVQRNERGGLNGGVGFTVRLGDKGWKFYTESRYHYAFHPRIPNTLVLVTFGIAYN